MFFSLFFSTNCFFICLRFWRQDASLSFLLFPPSASSFSRVRLSKHPFCDMVSAKFSPSGIHSQHCIRGGGWKGVSIFRHFSHESIQFYYYPFSPTALCLFLFSSSPLSPLSLTLALPFSPLYFICRQDNSQLERSGRHHISLVPRGAEGRIEKTGRKKSRTKWAPKKKVKGGQKSFFFSFFLFLIISGAKREPLTLLS